MRKGLSDKGEEAELDVRPRATPEDEGAEELPQLPPNARAQSGLLGKIRGRLPKNRDAMNGGDIVKRRKVSFVMDGAACAPGFFVDDAGNYYDFKVSLHELDSAEEIAAYSGIGAQGQAVMSITKKMLCEIEGDPIPEEMRDLIWDALGPKGRSLCAQAMQSLASVGMAELGKFRGTFEAS